MENIVFSASQISTFRDCQRKWGFAYIEGFRAPPGPSAELGLRVHAVAENWLRDGVPPALDTEEGLIFSEGMRFLPPPRKAEVEQQIFLQTPVAVIQGYVDCRWLEDPYPVVLDHKTTSDFRWAKTETDLLSDVQANIYAAETMSRYNLDAVQCRWVYYKTKKPYKAMKVELLMRRPLVEKVFDEIDVTMAQMLLAHQQVTSANDLPPTIETCAAYGGCPHAQSGRCNITAKDTVKAMVQHQTLAEKVLAKRAAAAQSEGWIPNPNGPGWEYLPSTGEQRPIAAAPPPPPPVAVAPPPPPVSVLPQVAPPPPFAAAPPPPPVAIAAPPPPPLPVAIAAPPPPPVAIAAPPPPPVAIAAPAPPPVAIAAPAPPPHAHGIPAVSVLPPESPHRMLTPLSSETRTIAALERIAGAFERLATALEKRV